MYLRALFFLICLIFSSGGGIVLYGQSTATMVNWPAYAADKASSKYSPLDQIDRSNVQRLEIAWRQSTIPDAIRRGNSMPAPQRSQNTPLMVDGRLFVSTPLEESLPLMRRQVKSCGLIASNRQLVQEQRRVVLRTGRRKVWVLRQDV